jgi:hypothetical protein
LGAASDSPEVGRLREQVRTSSRAATLFSERDETGHIPHHPYRTKWYGAHWILVALTEMGYPTGDESLLPLRDQILGWLFSSDYERYLGRVHELPTLHASINGNAVWSALSLGIADDAPSDWSSGYSTPSGRTAAGTVTGARAGAPHPSLKASFRYVPWPCTPG